MDVWAVGEAYEDYVGRWSRLVAASFVRLLRVPPGLSWLDVGCGTGALTGAIASFAAPSRLVGVDPSEGFLALANVAGASFQVGDARELPFEDGSFDVVVSGLAVNFVPTSVPEMARVSASVVAAYVWDYAEGMQLMRYFWDAAREVDPGAAALDEADRFAICRPEALHALWTDAGLDSVVVDAITVPTVFRDFDDYWRPFLAGQGPAPSYLMKLPPSQRAAIESLLRSRLPLSLSAKAWVVKGSR